ncbi:hypothetical protein [Candidatus Methanomassiliicoccus intestinalis]|jgi:hypothetical protein|uniref:Uncharacterized protein n=2 Tax=Candidatus Methanomassiliicoccus intestinalis TaxID=1406512 RepID=R9T7L0_METII|nr:hypothetical protein [Candidatus Methanomassiliicoccus intestinalis]AGN26639.1 hypothetical protein MMINT_13130 [Candidatus Methanomassiliicoccus intestinalis Issoire-Mx1]TQS83457.1 MAG: hypothetical protein A3207_07615 [Candidatus Methanomassiliicoccus intestinalis]TQS83557.1 MAG: hypothetical protein A3206_05740 [Candidatus Methanomassiliicoccus intestinalis]
MSQDNEKSSCKCGCEDEFSEEDLTSLDELAEEVIFGKNQNRSHAIKDLWFEDMTKYLKECDSPEESKPELMFLSLSNALLDMFFDIVPREFAIASANNMSQFLTTLLINKEYNIDVMEKYMEDYNKTIGDSEDADEIETFDENWWNEKREYLNGKTMNDAITEMSEKYGL